MLQPHRVDVGSVEHGQRTVHEQLGTLCQHVVAISNLATIGWCMAQRVVLLMTPITRFDQVQERVICVVVFVFCFCFLSAYAWSQTSDSQTSGCLDTTVVANFEKLCQTRDQ